MSGSLASSTTYDLDPKANLVNWTDAYQPWMLFFRAMALVGKQVGPLMLAYFEMAEWNPRHYYITLHCPPATFGTFGSYVCEGTKGFARCFPLLSISVTLIVTGRFILQSRIHYHCLTSSGSKKAILDFDNYAIHKDKFAQLLLACFLAGTLHWIIGLYYVPQLVRNPEKLLAIGRYLGYMLVFFFVFENGCQIENHLVTLNKFYEYDEKSAKESLQKAEIYEEACVKMHAEQVMERLKMTTNEAHPADIDELVKQTIIEAEKTLTSNQPQDVPFFLTDIFKGMWPGHILLFENLQDRPSRQFKKTMKVYVMIFIVAHVVLINTLLGATLREVRDAIGDNHPPVNSKRVGDSWYELLGTGYCRNEYYQRPHHYWKKWESFGIMKDEIEAEHTQSLTNVRKRKKSMVAADPILHPSDIARKSVFLSVSRNATSERDKSRSFSTGAMHTTKDETLKWYHRMNPRNWVPQELQPLTPTPIRPALERNACGEECNSIKDCIGFALDPEYCTLYTSSTSSEVPSSWTHSPTTERTTVGFSSHIALTSNYEEAECWTHYTGQGEPADIAHAAVCLVHVVLIVTTMTKCLYYLGLAPADWKRW